MRQRVLPGLFGIAAALATLLATAATPVSSGVAFVDVHTHPEASDAERAVEAARQALAEEHAVRIVLMPPPFAPQDAQRYDVERFLSIARRDDRLVVLGGGGTLNPMIQEAVRTGDAGPEVQRRFRQRAEELLRLGVAGFGEMAAEHLKGATGYQWAPPDHPLFLLLADIAAEHGVPIDLHMEAVPQDMPLPRGLPVPPNPPALHANIAAFERLLAHNEQARIIWAHAGWDNTGYRTPQLCRRLLQAHPNLFMDLKVDPFKPGLNAPLTRGGEGAIKPEWLALLKDFPDRFVMGTDQHYPQPPVTTQRWQAARRLLDQLPGPLARQIGIDNAERLYPSAR